MEIIEVNLHSSPEKKKFVDLPYSLYSKTPQWVPPLSTDKYSMFDPQKNLFINEENVAFYIAIDDHGNSLARLVVFINQKFNKFNNESTAFINLFESVNDPEISQNLFLAAANWAENKGANKLSGPKGFTPLDGMGLLVEGFDISPGLGLPYNFSYYQALFENFEFEQKTDVVSGILDVSVELNEKIHRVARLVQEKRGFSVRNFSSRTSLAAYIPKFMKMYNESLAGTTGNVPLAENDIKTMTNQLLWFANPKLIKIIEKNKLPIGFLLAYPDITRAIQRTKGKIFPFGWICLLSEARKTTHVNINGAAILEEYRGMGGTALLYSEMFNSVKCNGYKTAEVIQIGIENEKMQLEMRNMGINFYKTHRIYEKTLK